jgi:hypothetical protein
MVMMLNTLLKIIFIWRILYYGSLFLPSSSFSCAFPHDLLENTIKNNNNQKSQQHHVRKLLPTTMEATPRIINGIEVQPLRYPYVTLLAADGGILKCAGSVCLSTYEFVL